MLQQSFDESDWIDHLATTLEYLAHFLTASRINLPPLTNEQYRTLANRVVQEADDHILFNQYVPVLNSDPTKAIEILKAHPLISRELLSSPKDDAIMMGRPPGSWSRVELKRLVTFLTRSTIKRDGHSAASLLQNYLTLSDKKDLPGFEITVFYGLEVNERMEIDEGVFLAPYTKIVELGLINEREPFPWDDIPDYRELNAVALVRDLSWGPGIGPPMSGLDSFGTVPNVTFRYLDSHENHSVIFDFLTIATRHELTILSVDYYPDKSMEDIDPIYNRDLKPNFFTPPRLNTRKLFTEQDAAKLRGLLCVWAGYEQDRIILDLAIRRLASSISRKGRFELADRILDIAVALEIMYKLEGPEITYKLATRTAYFVGADAEERHDLFKKIRSFYEVRSSIVHRGMARTHTGTFKNAADDGFELAYNTLSKLLDQGETPDWNKLVVTGEI